LQLIKKPHLSSIVEDELATTLGKLETSEELLAYLNHVQHNISLQVRF
jgi:hypothetical protein